MTPTASEIRFTGSIPQLYERHLVPLIFDPYAADLAQRAQALAPSRVLEVAAGTGAVTRHLARLLPPGCPIVATDLNEAMIAQASQRGTERPVDWRVADAMHLPFDDQSFDLVACQFGAMFFPDRGGGFAQARRVLRPGGHFLFNVWDRLESNEFAEVLCQVLARLFPDDPPRFLERVPHGYNDPRQIREDVARGGFTEAPAIEALAFRSRAPSAHEAATAYCQGTPVRSEIEARDPHGLERATEAVAEALRERFGDGPIEGRIQALVVSVRR